MTPAELFRDSMAQAAAVEQYRLAAAYHRTMGREVERTCSHGGECAGGPCMDAARFYRMARHLEAAAWLERHNGVYS